MIPKHRKMFKKALKIALKVVTDSHVYVFGSDIKSHRKGGPIVLDLAGAMAHIYLCWVGQRA